MRSTIEIYYPLLFTVRKFGVVAISGFLYSQVAHSVDSKAWK